MFFEAGRTHFFRPLANSYRHAVLACLSDLYLRTHGAHADYSCRHTRDTVRDRFTQLLQEDADLRLKASQEEGETRGAKELANHILGELVDCGWLVTPIDSATRVELVQFSRAGKQFGGILANFETPRLATRTRNLRVCANSLSAYLEHADPDDLLEAYNAAQNVIHDLTELIEQVRDATRTLLSGATSLETVVPDLLAFLDMFDREIRPHLTTEGVDRHQHRILSMLEQLRAASPAHAEEAEHRLNSVEPRLRAMRGGDSSRLWLLERIEDMVDAACSAKRPELFEALHSYQLRHQRLVRQGMAMRTAARESLTGRLDAMTPAQMTELADALAVGLAPSRVRLVDEVSISAGLKAIASMANREQSPLTVDNMEVPEEERERAFVHNAVMQSYALPFPELSEQLKERMKGLAGLRLSELHDPQFTFTSMQEFMAWSVVAQGIGCRVRVVDEQLETEYLVSNDLLMEPA